MGRHDRDLTAADAVLVCVARGHGDRWEALCLDYDIAVQGASLPEVREKLELALHDYVAAEAEAEPARSQLLGRRAPFFVRLSWGFRFLVGTIFGRNRDGDSTVGFPVTCHA